MSSLTEISYVKDVLARHGFHFAKSMGQNFLINPTVCPKWRRNAARGRSRGS